MCLVVRGFRTIPPQAFQERYWPHVRFYDKQWEIINSTVYDDETVVVAGNKLGKDYVAGFICLYHFLAVHGPTVRVVTTSVDDTQLDVLWGEIGRYINTCRFPLRAQEGGPLLVNDRHIRKIVGGQRDEISYILGRVAKEPEGMSGHHSDHTLGVVDEASGIKAAIFDEISKWAKRKLIFGNPLRPVGPFYEMARLYEAGSIPHTNM